MPPPGGVIVVPAVGFGCFRNLLVLLTVMDMTAEVFIKSVLLAALLDADPNNRRTA